MPISLQSAGTETKQKKVHGPIPKYGESARINDTFKHNYYCCSSFIFKRDLVYVFNIILIVDWRKLWKINKGMLIKK